MNCLKNLNWEPSIGWNDIFSRSDRIEYRSLYFFLKTKKGLNDKNAEIYAEMILFSKKYNVRYSEEQEEQIKELLKPAYNAQ